MAGVRGTELLVMAFQSQKTWEKWLSTNHEHSDGIWLQFYKKHSDRPTVTHSDALDSALCYGWIDGQLKPFDTESWLHKFTPRRARSVWSKQNTARVARLTAAGRMRRAGLKEVDAAKVSGRWQKAYDSPKGMTVPKDFVKELSKDKEAKAFFATLNRANKYAIAWRLQTAGTAATREKRLRAILEMLSAGKAFHP